MEGFSGKLEVGQMAMVVGCRDPRNSHVIGKIVTIEGLCDIGPVPPEWYNPVFEKDTDINLALVTGLGSRGGHRENCSTIQQRHLMPLPPLDDDAIIFANENVKETEKCS